jgi:phosphoribosylaminoimidazolecarboxamide formyltransferase/IMP cyclohydrolase
MSAKPTIAANPANETEPQPLPIRRALISVSDKSGVVAFARGLEALGVEIGSTGGTAAALREGGVEVRTVEELTGAPEILDGRVKTLHPRLHGALLAVRDDPDHAATLADEGIEEIDLVCTNLYPFERAAARREASDAEIIENIDIGGPAMIRAAAKNHRYVAVVVRPET